MVGEFFGGGGLPGLGGRPGFGGGGPIRPHLNPTGDRHNDSTNEHPVFFTEVFTFFFSQTVLTILVMRSTVCQSPSCARFRQMASNVPAATVL